MPKNGIHTGMMKLILQSMRKAHGKKNGRIWFRAKIPTWQHFVSIYVRRAPGKRKCEKGPNRLIIQ